MKKTTYLELFSKKFLWVGLFFGLLGSLEAQAQIEKVAGLPFPSGVFRNHPTVVAMRGGRKADICTLFTGGVAEGESTWQDIEHPTAGISAQLYPNCNRYLMSLRIFPGAEENPNKMGCTIWKRASEGAYDSHYEAAAQDLRDNGPGTNMVIRVGWELSHTFPWNVGVCGKGLIASPADEVLYYRRAHRRIVNILKRYMPDIKVSWNFLREATKLPRPIDEYFPGTAFVDFVSIDYYDFYMDNTTAAKFAASANAGTVQVPRGIARWLEFAKTKGKPLSVDEWGVWNGTHGNGDNPVFIEEMYKFFAANAPFIGYESYFNQRSFHTLVDKDGNTPNPRAKAMYAKYWGKKTQ